MTYSELLKSSGIRLDRAIVEDDLDLAHQVMDERLALLRTLWHEKEFTPDLITAAQESLVLHEKLQRVISRKKETLRQELHRIVVADRANQSYKAYSK